MLAAFFLTQRHEGAKARSFFFAQSTQRSKDAKHFFETQIHEAFLLKKVANEWKILSASPLGD